MIEAIKDRLETNVRELRNRVDGAGNFAALMQKGSLPSAPVYAYVLYGGLTAAGKPDVMTGVFRQEIRESINIVLILKSNDADGRRAMDDVKTLTKAILDQLCGWAPSDETGVFQLARSAPVSFRKGVLVWETNLTISDQLRITT